MLEKLFVLTYYMLSYTMDFSAQSSALGYLYQIRYALYLLLRSEKDESELAIEKLDDISFVESGTPRLRSYEHRYIRIYHRVEELESCISAIPTHNLIK